MVTAFFSIASLISRWAARASLLSTFHALSGFNTLPATGRDRTGYSHFFHLKMMNGRIAAAIISTIANG